MCNPGPVAMQSTSRPRVLGRRAACGLRQPSGLPLGKNHRHRRDCPWCCWVRTEPDRGPGFPSRSVHSHFLRVSVEARSGTSPGTPWDVRSQHCFPVTKGGPRNGQIRLITGEGRQPTREASVTCTQARCKLGLHHPTDGAIVTRTADQLATDARDLAVHVEALTRHVEALDRPLGHHAREARLHLLELADHLAEMEANR